MLTFTLSPFTCGVFAGIFGTLLVLVVVGVIISRKKGQPK